MKLNQRSWLWFAIGMIVLIFLFQRFNKKNQNLKTSQKSSQQILKEEANVSKPLKVDRSVSSLPANQKNNQAQPSVVSNFGRGSIHNFPNIQSQLIEALRSKTGLSGWQVDGTEGVRKDFSVSGEIFKFPLGSISDRLQWAQFLAEQLGIHPDQIIDAGARLEDSMYTQSYELNQSFKGYLVDGSFVRLHERKADGFIYFSSTSLRDIGHPDLGIKVDLSEAQKFIRRSYSSIGPVEIIKAAKDPVIFSISQGHSELAWRIDFKIAGSFSDIRQVMVSAKTGNVLREVPISMF